MEGGRPDLSGEVKELQRAEAAAVSPPLTDLDSRPSRTKTVTHLDKYRTANIPQQGSAARWRRTYSGMVSSQSLLPDGQSVVQQVGRFLVFVLIPDRHTEERGQTQRKGPASGSAQLWRRQRSFQTSFCLVE